MARACPRLLLVTGCPRSGTKYIASLLHELGLDIRHEAMGRDGIASWCMATHASAAPYGPALADQPFDAIYHQVRNPLHVIPSMTTLSEQTWEFVYPLTSCRPEDPMLVRCAKLWHDWNLHAQRLASWRYRVEDLPIIFDSFCERVGVTPDRHALQHVAPNVNTRAFSGLARVCKAVCSKMNVEPPAILRNRFVDRSVYQRSCTFTWATLRRLDPEVCDRTLALAREYGYYEVELQVDAMPVPLEVNASYAPVS